MLLGSVLYEENLVVYRRRYINNGLKLLMSYKQHACLGIYIMNFNPKRSAMYTSSANLYFFCYFSEFKGSDSHYERLAGTCKYCLDFNSKVF
jgi:hypothetical protein